MAASRTGVVGVPFDVDVTCVLSFTSAFPTQRRWVMIKTNFQPKIGLKQPNALTQRSQPSIWVEKTTQRSLECTGTGKEEAVREGQTRGCSGEPKFMLLASCVIMSAGKATLCLWYRLNASSSQADLVLFLPDH